VLFPAELKLSKSMKRVLNSNKFSVTVDQCFDKVITNCSSVEREGQSGTWITPAMKTAYIQLHRQGYAHSVEVWQQNKLVGGLYGVQIGRVFCGESMFSRVSNASKVALIHICNSGQYNLIDCQVHTDHLESMGARLISRDEYMNMVKGKL